MAVDSHDIDEFQLNLDTLDIEQLVSRSLNEPDRSHEVYLRSPLLPPNESEGERVPPPRAGVLSAEAADEAARSGASMVCAENVRNVQPEQSAIGDVREEVQLQPEDVTDPEIEVLTTPELRALGLDVAESVPEWTPLRPDGGLDDASSRGSLDALAIWGDLNDIIN